MAVQAIHASIESARCGLIPADVEHPHCVLLGINNEEKLYQVQHKLTVLGIAHKSFYEPDRCHELTAIATGLISGDLRNHFKNYQLLSLSHPVGSFSCAKEISL